MNWNWSIKVRRQQMHGGFTTVELIVTIAILALLASFAVPMIQDYMPSYHLKQAARTIVSQMQFARIRAIRDRVTAVVVFSPSAFTSAGGVGSFLIYEDADNDWIQDAGETEILPSTVMPRHVSLITANFVDNGSGQPDATECCGFDSRGVGARASGGGAYVTGFVDVTNKKNETRRITLYASGKTTITIP